MLGYLQVKASVCKILCIPSSLSTAANGARGKCCKLSQRKSKQGQDKLAKCTSSHVQLKPMEQKGFSLLNQGENSLP